MVNRIATSQNSIRLVLVTVLLVTVFLLASCTGNTDDPGDRAPLIFAAASLADVLEDAAELYEEDTGKQVAFNFGGSIALANQIASFGAPADGFVFVGDRPVEVIEQAGLLPENGVTNLWANSLVVVAQKNTRSLASLNEIATEGMRVAIGDPVLAPAGSYSRQALEAAGIWDDLVDRLIFTVDVRAAMAAVSSGNAKYGIVYKTDAATSESLAVVFEIMEGYFQIRYAAASLEGASNEGAAKDFLDFISTEAEPRALFEAAGFTALTTAGRS